MKKRLAKKFEKFLPLHSPHSTQSTSVSTTASLPTVLISGHTASLSNSATSIPLAEGQSVVSDISNNNLSEPTVALKPEENLPCLPPPSKRFVDVKTTSDQQNLIIIHVAYILQTSPDLRGLILEIIKLGRNPGFEDVIKDCISYSSRLIAALDSPTVTPTDLEHVIQIFLKDVKDINLLNDVQEATSRIRMLIGQFEIDHPDIPKIEPKTSWTAFSKLTSKALGVALPMLDVFEKSSSMIPIPMVGPLIGVVAGLLKAADQAVNNFEWMRWLSITSAECVVEIAVRCSIPLGQQTEHQWKDAIMTLQRKLFSIAQRAEELSRQGVASRFLMQSLHKGAIEMMKNDLQVAILNFNAQIGMEIKLELERMTRKIDGLSLASLPYLKMSDKVSQDDRIQASRQKEIGDVLQWIEDSNDMHFLWIHGPPGVGKSTLARRLLDHIKEEGILATFAYFSLGSDVDPKTLVRMMARELSSLHPGCQDKVITAITACSGMHHCLDDYLIHFLVKPIASLEYAGSLVIILDALDEWVHREEFLEALRKINLPPASLKFVMTSRYSEDINSIIDGTAYRYELKTVSRAISRKYFEERFVKDKIAPGEVRLNELVKLADGLLIWAATVCTLVSTPRSRKSPLQILDDIISSSLAHLGHRNRMEVLYREAIDRVFPPESQEDEEPHLMVFLSMVALRETLPLTEFARLLDMTPEFVQDVCSRLRSFQTRGTYQENMVQPAVSLFHASFIEHLDRDKKSQAVMTDSCMHLLKKVMGSNIIGETFSPQEAEQYTCEHWVYHLQEAPQETRVNVLDDSDVPYSHRHMWVGCLLSHLFRLGDKHRYGPGSDQNIDLAISRYQHGDHFAPPRQNELPGWLHNAPNWYNNYGNWYLEHSKQSGDLQDIGRAISRHQSAIDFTPPGHAFLPSLFGDLGSSYFYRFQRTGNPQDISCAISYHQRSVTFTPAVHNDLPSRLNNLGNAYLHRFGKTGDFQDIELSIFVQQLCAELTPPGYIGLPHRLDNLGTAYLCRFERTGELQDIRSAVSFHQQAIELTASEHTVPRDFISLDSFKQAGFLEDIDSSMARYDTAVSDLQDIDFAVSIRQKVIDITPSGHPLLSKRFNDLANIYSHRFRRSGDLQDVELAILHHKKAINITMTSARADLSVWLNSLGTSYFRRYEHTGDLQDINNAISYHEQAVSTSTSLGHKDLPIWLNDLGNSYSLRFKTSKHLPDAQNGHASYRQGADSSGSPSIRFLCAKNAVKHSAVHDRLQHLDDLALAIGLLSEVVGLDQNIRRRYTNVHGHSDFVSSAVAAAVDMNKLDLAVEWFEQGRCLVWNQLDQLRTPVDHLNMVNPSLFDQFTIVARALGSYESHSRFSGSSSFSLTDEIRLQNDTQDHIHHIAKYKRLLAHIRNQPGFENFLRPPKTTDILRALPSDGPIIVFNLYGTRCDALVLIAGLDDPLHIPLERFNRERAEMLKNAFESGLQQHRGPLRALHNGKRPSVSFVLKDLWERVVKPILETLGYSPNKSERRRIWWCPSGPLSFLPLHAAGMYDSQFEPGSCISDYAVSSYTPSVYSLIQAYRASKSAAPRHTSIVLIGSNTPGIPPMPFVRKEIHDIKTLMNPSVIDVLVLEDDAAKRDNVLKELNAHGCVHFAGAANRDVADPLKSCVFLHDGRLELLEIMRHKLLNPELAFLSACQTSQGDPRVADEVVHLAAGMLAAGYRGVVGTMWDISDQHGPEFAETFYRYMLSERCPDGLDSSRAAYALDYAMVKVRQRLGGGDAALKIWVPYVHFGY